MTKALAQITPAARMAHQPVGIPAEQSPVAKITNFREKAAIIVRLLLAEGAPLPLNSLPEHMQAALTEQIGRMRLVDRVTMDGVVQDFLTELQAVGLAFPGGIEGALSIMDGHISATAANRLRRLAGASAKADPWDGITALPPERLMPVLEEECIEIAAVMLSKLPVPKAADLLGRLSGERARRVAYAVSMTGNVDPETVRRIGISLAMQFDNLPPRAFENDPVERVGAILNVSPAETRESVLKGLDEADAGFAELVRRAIFTFVHLPDRVLPRDVPKILRVVPQAQVVTALVAAQATPEAAAAAEFLLANLSQRMAQTLREEMGERGKVKTKDGDAAMSAIIIAVRTLEASGEVTLVVAED
jgi:flagellar motor switch protein FliG